MFQQGLFTDGEINNEYFHRFAQLNVLYLNIAMIVVNIG